MPLHPMRPIAVALGLAFVAGQPALAQPVSVENVTAIARPTRYSGACPGVITFTGTIYTSGPADVSYRWERSDGSTSPVRNAHVGGGPLSVTNVWKVGTSAKAFHGSARLRVFSPGDIYSSEASFTVACGGVVIPKPVGDD